MVFGWFKKDKPTARVEPPVRKGPPLLEMPALAFFAGEAATSLGYVKPEAADTILRLLQSQVQPVDGETIDGYRKQGEQISDAEKKTRGIRKNAFMSQAAASDLTEKGWTKPLDAHAVTIRRALFAWTRVRNIRQAQELGCDQFEYDSVMDKVCPACDALDGHIVAGADVLIFPPDGCLCETGRYILHPKIDWFADLTDDDLKGWK